MAGESLRRSRTEACPYSAGSRSEFPAQRSPLSRSGQTHRLAFVILIRKSIKLCARIAPTADSHLAIWSLFRKFRAKNISPLDYRRFGEQFGRLGHERFGYGTVQMSLASAFVGAPAAACSTHGRVILFRSLWNRQNISFAYCRRCFLPLHAINDN